MAHNPDRDRQTSADDFLGSYFIQIKNFFIFQKNNQYLMFDIK